MDNETVVDQLLRMMISPDNTWQPSTFMEMMLPPPKQ